MNPQEAILKIKQLFEDSSEAEKPVVEEEVKMAEYSLKDGTKVSISALEVGGDVKLEDGSAAPDGEHELADGTVIVTEAGKIKEVKGVEEPSVEVEIEAGKDYEKKMDEMQSAFDSKLDSLKAENESLKNQLAEFQTKIKNGFSQVLDLVESLNKTPHADPIEKPSVFKFQSTSDMKLERLSKYRNAILNNKN